MANTSYCNEKQDFLIICCLTTMMMEAILILKWNPLLDEKSNFEKNYFVNEKQIQFIKTTS